jgi:hypothetical protein
MGNFGLLLPLSLDGVELTYCVYWSFQNQRPHPKPDEPEPKRMEGQHNASAMRAILNVLPIYIRPNIPAFAGEIRG